MPPGSGTTESSVASDAGGNQLVPNQLAILVPTFDPSKDDIRVFSQKVSLLTKAWPENRFAELATRLILGFSGSAFQKLQLRQQEFTANSVKSIEKIIEVLGGDWGQIPLEKKYECAERAIFHCTQRADESNDSYLARADILWTELLEKGMKLEELQSYIVLRGSGLSSDDKKRVVLESNATSSPALDMKKVSQSIRMLGAGFFHDVTGQRKPKTKIYDPDSILLAEESETLHMDFEPTFQAQDDDTMEDLAVETFINEGDTDAIYIADFEGAAGDLLQADEELAACYNTYVEARQRLAEKAKHRGFWPSSFRGGKGKGKNQVKGKFNKSFGKGSSSFTTKKSLQYRILNSNCRRCNQPGHWKAECPLNRNDKPGSSTASVNSTVARSHEGGQSDSASVFKAETFHVDALPLEFLNLSEVQITSIDESFKQFECSFVSFIHDYKGSIHNDRGKNIVLDPSKSSLRHHNTAPRSELMSQCDQIPSCARTDQSMLSEQSIVLAATACSHGTFGVLDSGATKTVIGSQHVADLIAGFEPSIQQKLQRTSCSITFRFGNQGTLDASQALVVPLGSLLLKIAIVPGATPFLVSNSLIRALRCTIDTDRQEVRSPLLKAAVPLQLTSKGLYLIDINKIAVFADIRRKEVIETYTVEDKIDNPPERCPHDDAKNQLGTLSNSEVVPQTQVRSLIGDSSPGVTSCHVKPQSPSEATPSASSRRASGADSHESRGAIRDDGQLRINSQRQDISGDVGITSKVDCFHDGSLYQVDEDRASSSHGVHRAEDSRSRGTGDSNSSDRQSQQARELRLHAGDIRSGQGIYPQTSTQDQVQGEGELPPGHSISGSRRDGATGRFMVRGRTTSSDGNTSRCDGPADQDVESRDNASASPESTEPAVIRDQCNLCNDLAGDVDSLEEWLMHMSNKGNQDSVTGPLNQERARLQYLVGKYTNELNQQKFQIKPDRMRCTLFEVFCGENSQLTNQCTRLHGQAFRFGLTQGNLQTVEGRKVLFQQLCEKKPEHIWFSPTCGPWSAWSQFNGQRSIAAWEDLLAQRLQQLEQVALGVVLFRHQKEHQRHLHWEQPARSLMFKMPYLSEVFASSKCAEFDMCNVGELTDPENGKPIKKGMIVVTTSPSLYKMLHGRYCPGHDHQRVEGSTTVDGKSIKISQYTENYPRKFARQVAQVICSTQGQEIPIWCSDPAEAFAARSQEGEPSPKRIKSLTDSRVRLKQPGVSIPPDSPCPKRRKIESKQTPLSQKEMWNQIFRTVNDLTPRVGKKIIHDVEILNQIGDIWTDKHIQFIVVCRGTDRALGPNCNLIAGEAPYRRCAFVHRTTGEINIEDHWEKWDQLSQRQINRPNHPCKLNMTVFARNPDEKFVEPTGMPGLREPIESISPTEQLSQSPDSAETESPSTESAPTDPIEVDASHCKHGPRFLALSSEERSKLVKIHRNMGHPSAERLMHLLRQQGFRKECIDAIPDMRCSTCEVTSKPKCSRPSVLKDPMDFNDKIAVDCIKWTNKAGLGFHIMHIIDHGTSYHIACVAPCRTSQSAIQNITSSWFQWAGAPNEMIVDCATEFNSEEFMNFLQRNNIKCTTIVPEGHWQNGRSERHGAILESMLTKFDIESPIMTYSDLQQALWFIMQSKNACTLRRGYAPEVLVFGKHTRVPGSISSDETISAHCLADSESAQGLAFRKQLELREVARKAFWHADNQASLRRDMLRRSRPARKNFATGEWVMVWKSTPKPGTWIGPMRVVTHENVTTIWLTMSGKLFRAAPENVRDVSAMETLQIPKQESTFPVNQKGITQFRELLPQDGANGGSTTIHPIVAPIEIPPAVAESDPPIPGNPSDHNQESSGSQPDHEPDVPSQPEVSTPTGTDIPIPESLSEDENLHCVGLHSCDMDTPCLVSQTECDQPKGIKWMMEVYITQDDIESWKSEPDSTELAFLASAAKRQRAEVRMSELTAEERRQFTEAKNNEVTNWIKTGTVMKILRNAIPPEEVLRCRWVLTWKPVESDENNPEPSHKAKARLVVLGYMDPSIDTIPRDSPTLGRHAKMLILQMIASRGWTLQSFDVKAAFLQGSVTGRVIGLEPVPELAKALNMSPQELCKLNKSAYGLVDAPYLWYKALLTELERLGFIQSPFDPCVFLLKRPHSDKISGVLGVHVDDGLCGGDDFFAQQIHQLSKKYAFGAQKSVNFVFTGIELSQKGDKGIILSQSKYVREISPIHIDVNRKTDSTLKVNDSERHALRGLIGSLQYAAVNTRPDLSSQLSSLQSAINQATIETLIQANKTLHDAKKHHDVTITIHPIPNGDVRFLAFSDASFSSKKVPDSHAGSIILTTHKDIVQNITCPVSPISWGCKKIQKVVTSTLSAETMALTSSLDQLSWLRLFWAWLNNPSIAWKNPSQSLQSLPSAIASPTWKAQNLPEAISATDCKSLFDLVTQTAPPQCSEFRTQLHARAIKDMLSENTTLRWVHSGAQLADALTKIMEASFLRNTLKYGRYRLNDEMQILKQRSTNRNRLKWLRSSCGDECCLVHDTTFM